MNKLTQTFRSLPILGMALLAPLSHAQQPNVIVIIADDAGYADWGFMDGVDGSNPTPSDIPTPNLDSLATNGVRFSRAYVGVSCQPTRSALVTGGYQNRIGNEVVGNNYYLASQGFAQDGYPEGVPSSAVTIWERMKSQGYDTYAVGKWHIGQVEDTPTVAGNRPEFQGVDHFTGIWHGSRTYFMGIGMGSSNYQTQALREVSVDGGGNVTDTIVEGNYPNGSYITNIFGDYALAHITASHAASKPFFLYQSFTAPHTPMQNSPDFNDPRIAGLTGIRKQYASMVLTMDKEIGRILDRLDDPNNDSNTSDSIRDNTLIIFINDNGGADVTSSSPNGSDNGVLRDGKGSCYEGGIRVPMIISGAGVSPSVAGTTYAKPVHGVDVLPTAFEAAGGSFGPADTGIDGVNLLPFINGTNTADPHEVIVTRHRGQVGVIKGDWKLVKDNNNPTASFQLYNLASDVSETTNLAGSNPNKAEELKRDYINFESQFDKQRFEILGSTNETSININDHFTFDPPSGTAGPGGPLNIIGDSTTSKTPTTVGTFSNLGNGDMETMTSPANSVPVSNVASWHNTSGSESQSFGTIQGTVGSPQSGSNGAFLSEDRLFANSTGYLIKAADVGKPFAVNMYVGQFGSQSNYTGDEIINAGLFYVTSNPAAGTIGDSTVEGDLTQLGSNLGINPFVVGSSGAFFAMAGGDIHTIAAGDVGKKVFLGLELQNNAGNNVFPRIDVVSLSITGGSTGSSSSEANWGSANAWLEGGTSNVIPVMFNSDPFPGTVLEFPTTNDFSYTSTNEIISRSGTDFMLNKIILSGNFSGSEDHSATIQGVELLFTDDLDGVGPQIAVDATQSGANGFTYNLDLDLELFDDLAFVGDGDVTVNVGGQISDYFNPRALTKSGTSTVVLSGSNSYSGDTTITGGVLSIASAYLDNGASVCLAAGGIIDLAFSGTDSVSSLFINGYSEATGTWGRIGSGAAHESSQITGDGLLSVAAVAPADYSKWAAANAPGQDPGDDHDLDGVKNGIEFFLGETGSGFTPLPSPDSSGAVTWPMHSTYAGVYGTDYYIQTSAPDLDSWMKVPSGDSNLTVTPGASVSYTLPTDATARFVRLVVVID